MLREFTHPNEDYPYSKIQCLAQVMAGAGQDHPGSETGWFGGRGLIGADVLAAFQAALPNAKWVDVENDLCALRAQKTPLNCSNPLCLQNCGVGFSRRRERD